MNKHYVDLNQIIDHLEDEWGYEGMREELYEIPPADVRENIHGEWIDKGSLSCRCSNCGCKSSKESKFCSECGADMRGEVNG